MSKAIEALVTALEIQIRGRITAEANSRDKSMMVNDLRKQIAEQAERIAELEAMPVAFEKADVGETSAEWLRDHDCGDEGCFEEVAEYDGWGYIDPATGQRFTRF